MTTRKIIALTIQNFVDKMMSLLSNMLSRFVIAFLSRRNSFFYFMVVANICSDLEPKKIKYISLLPLFSLLFAMKF